SRRGRHARSHGAKARQGGADASRLEGAFGRAPGDHRPRLLPGAIRRRGRRNSRHPRSDGENADVLCAQETLRTFARPRYRSRLAMTNNEERGALSESEEIAALLPWYVAG